MYLLIKSYFSIKSSGRLFQHLFQDPNRSKLGSGDVTLFWFRFTSLIVKLIAPPETLPIPTPPTSHALFPSNKMILSAGCTFQVLIDNQ